MCTMKWVFACIHILLIQPICSITISIGTEEIMNQPIPVDAGYNYSYSQIIYNRSEINHTGAITQISYPYHIVSNNFLSNVNQLKIYMGHTSRTAFLSTTDWVSLDSLQMVFDGDWNVSNFSAGPPGDGWVSIQLMNEFLYTDTQNLIIAVDENQPGNTLISDKFRCSSSTLTRSLSVHSDSANPDPSSPPTSSNPRSFYANIRLEMITDFPIPTNPYPVNGAESIELVPQFSWNCNADSYDFLLGIQSEHLVTLADTLSAGNWSPSFLLQANTIYYWQVKAHYGQQVADSPIWSFTTGNTTGIGIPFQECFDLNSFPPNQWLRLEGLYQPNSILIPSAQGWNWDYFGNQTEDANGSANLNIYGRDCYYWLISPPITGVTNSEALITFHALLRNWNNTTQGQLGEDDKIQLVLFAGSNASLLNATVLHGWTATDSIPYSNSLPFTIPAGIFRIGFYGESTVSNQDCDLFIDDFRILPEASTAIESPGDLSAVIEGSTIHLQWNAPVLYLASSYKIYRNNHLLNMCGLPEYFDVTAIQGQNYTYFVTAVNEDNTESTPSGSVSLTCVFTFEPLLYNSFESFQPFSQIAFPWINLDIDHHDTFGLVETDFPNEESPSSFVVFSPQESNPPFTALYAAEGQQYLAVFPDSPPPNNDWLIAPHLKLGTSSILSFKARSLSIDYGAERFRVGVSTSSASPDSFLIISNEPYLQAPAQWTEFTYDLSAYDGQDIYLAIQCVSYDCCMFALDEFKVISTGGYVGNDEHTVTAAPGALTVFPNPFYNQCSIRLNSPNKEKKCIDIYNIRGQRVYHYTEEKSMQIDVSWDGKDDAGKIVSAGVYIVRVKAGEKIICRKVVKY